MQAGEGTRHCQARMTSNCHVLECLEPSSAPLLEVYALLFPEPPPAPLHVVFEAASPVEPGVLQFLLDSLASKPRSPSCLCFLSAEIIGTCHCA